MGNMISPTVVLDHVTKRYGSTLALDRVSALILGDEPVAISGPDGRPLFPADEVQWAGTPFTFVAGNSTAHRQALEDLRT